MIREDTKVLTNVVIVCTFFYFAFIARYYFHSLRQVWAVAVTDLQRISSEVKSLRKIHFTFLFYLTMVETTHVPIRCLTSVFAVSQHLDDTTGFSRIFYDWFHSITNFAAWRDTGNIICALFCLICLMLEDTLLGIKEEFECTPSPSKRLLKSTTKL